MTAVLRLIRMRWLAAPLALSAAGCGLTQAPLHSGPDIEARLDDAMRRAAEASALAAGLELAAAGRPEILPADPPDELLPDALRARISVDWTGPLEPLVKAVAEEVGYGFTQTGPAHPPVILTIRRTDEQAWKILRDAGRAVTSRATIAVHADRRIIELRWPQVPA